MRSSTFASLFALALPLFAACAQGSNDTGPNEDAGPFEPFDASVQDATLDTAAPPGDDASPPGNDANGGGDTSSGDDTSTGDDSSTGTDASDANPPPVDAGNDTGSVAPKPAQGEVLITEVMFDPSGSEPGTEWFEVTNVASGARDLGGLTMTDGASTPHNETITGNVVVQPGAYVILANTAIGSAVPAAAIAYKYSTVTLVNGSTGTIVLSDGATTVAQCPYGGWSDSVNGKSVQLKPLTYADESKSASWCVSASTWSGSTDDGTPGAAGDCP